MNKNLVVLNFLCSFANSNTVRVVQLVRISDCGPEGRGFKSHLAPRELKERFSKKGEPFSFFVVSHIFLYFAP